MLENKECRRSRNSRPGCVAANKGSRFLFSLLFGAGFLVSGLSEAVTVISPPLTGGITAPQPGVILPGTALSPLSRQPVRHLWIPDHVNGFCRIDPDLGSPAPFAAVPGTCQSIGLLPAPYGPAVFDPATNFVYIADTGSKSLGIVRLKYNPAAGSGQGAIDPTVPPMILGGTDSCGVGGKNGRASAIALGPDGNLYVGQIKSGIISRITAPAAPFVSCNSFAAIATNADRVTVSGFAFVGKDLYGVGGINLFKIANATDCLPGGCAAPAALTTALPPGRLAQAVVSDQVYPASNGKTLYISDSVGVTKVSNPGASNQTVVQDWAILPFANPSSLTFDPVEPSLYIADDSSLGAAPLGSLYKATELAAATPPGPPANVTGIAGNTMITLNWVAGPQGSAPISSYTVSILTAAGLPTGLPDVVVKAVAPATVVPTTATVNGLINGTSYLFKVLASNSAGSSTAAQSALVAPTPPPIADAPPQPTIVAGNGALQLSWTAPAYTGTTPLTGYLLQCTTGATVVSHPPVAGNVTSLLLTGLTNGASYSCTVTAINSGGNSLPSIPAIAVPTVTGASVDVSLTGTGPSSVNIGSSAVYTFNFANSVNGFAIPDGLVTVNLPATGYIAAGTSVVWGTAPGTPCTLATPTSYTCHVGAMAAGAAPVAVTATLANLTAQVAVSANAAAQDSTGIPLVDSNPANNAVPNITTTVVTPDPPIDLAVTATGPASVVSGAAATQVYTVTNAGTGAVAQAEVDITVPPTGFAAVTVTPSTGSCTLISPSLYKCKIGVLAVAGKATVNVAYSNATAQLSSSAVTNGLTATGAAATDSNLLNNTAAVSTAVILPPPPVLVTNLSLTATGTATVVSGGNASYIFNVANPGTAAVPQAVLTVKLPTAGFTTATASGTGAVCTLATSIFTCKLGAKAAGAAATPLTVTLTRLTAAATVSGTVAAQTLTGAAITDSVPANNTATLATAVTQPAGACIATAVTMTLQGSLLAGTGVINTNQTHQWRATNTNRTVASNCVTFSYALPANMRFQSAGVFNAGTTTARTGATCKIPAVGTVSGTISCTLSTGIIAGGMVDFRVVAQPTVSKVAYTNTGRLTWTSTAAVKPNLSSAITYTTK